MDNIVLEFYELIKRCEPNVKFTELENRIVTELQNKYNSHFSLLHIDTEKICVNNNDISIDNYEESFVYLEKMKELYNLLEKIIKESYDLSSFQLSKQLYKQELILLDSIENVNFLINYLNTFPKTDYCRTNLDYRNPFSLLYSNVDFGENINPKMDIKGLNNIPFDNKLEKIMGHLQAYYISDTSFKPVLSKIEIIETKQSIVKAKKSRSNNYFYRTLIPSIVIFGIAIMLSVLTYNIGLFDSGESWLNLVFNGIILLLFSWIAFTIVYFTLGILAQVINDDSDSGAITYLVTTILVFLSYAFLVNEKVFNGDLLYYLVPFIIFIAFGFYYTNENIASYLLSTVLVGLGICTSFFLVNAFQHYTGFMIAVGIIYPIITNMMFIKFSD